MVTRGRGEWVRLPFLQNFSKEWRIKRIFKNSLVGKSTVRNSWKVTGSEPCCRFTKANVAALALTFQPLSFFVPLPLATQPSQPFLLSHWMHPVTHPPPAIFSLSLSLDLQMCEYFLGFYFQSSMSKVMEWLVQAEAKYRPNHRRELVRVESQQSVPRVPSCW